jgi:hypothetical protein
MSAYSYGKTINIAFQAINPDTGELFDPATLQISVETPLGVVTTYVYLTDSEVTKLGIGQYRAKIGPCEEEGRWDFAWEGPDIAEAGDFRINAPTLT